MWQLLRAFLWRMWLRTLIQCALMTLQPVIHGRRCTSSTHDTWCCTKVYEIHVAQCVMQLSYKIAKIAWCIPALQPLSHSDRCATEEAPLDNCFYKTVYRNEMMHSRRGSLGPSTVILMALWYVATWGGLVNTVMVRVKLFPGEREGKKGQVSYAEWKDQQWPMNDCSQNLRSRSLSFPCCFF